MKHPTPCLWILIVVVGLAHVATLAQTTEHAKNFSSCMQGLATCTPALLTQPETAAVALAGHNRNLADCRMGAASCDRSKLTRQRTMDWQWPGTNATFLIAWKDGGPVIVPN